MSKEQWTAVDRYIEHLLLPDDPVLEAALITSAGASLPAIGVSPPQGRMLELLARIRGARTILELGTLGGYSTIWLARALPADGRLVTLEVSPAYSEVARGNIARAGLDHLVEQRIGPAIETLPALVAEGAGPFDFIFIDADKVSYPDYLPWTLELAAPGTVIVADNLVRGGAVLDPADDDPSSGGSRRFTELLGAEPRVTATLIQTVGSKGYDGFALAVVNA
ncbi:MAG TPA: O-methyltransferase [Solirubrobacteraceae bacterium]|jgi:predicted O-methyltransferase YrrM|nr:O-methyltransferase [Solirubrobacteraceae bacterium]